MRKLITLSALAVIATVAACAVADHPTGSAFDRDAAPTFSSGVPDTDGFPDLIVDAKATQNNWLVRVENLPANFCSVIEGGVAPGERTLLRFTVTTPNIGDADVFIGSPLAHIDPNGDGNYRDSDGLYEFATCHNHFHFNHYAAYRLLDASGKEWKAAKQGFCMLDTDPYNVKNGDGTWTYRSCGTQTRDGFQGISAGWADTYMFFLGGQYFVLDGGDGQPAVPPGDYIIEVTVNPPFTAKGREPCPAVDPQGFCHMFTESDYSNNVGRAYITIPDHPGRSGYGPLKNDPKKITKEDDIDHHGQQ
ncbi:MAG: lysyl oxidase family protein [Gemmatimonadota bacterium]|nr:lysyl oxidase family protein [Gemmatimonadota bacterium]